MVSHPTRRYLQLECILLFTLLPLLCVPLSKHSWLMVLWPAAILAWWRIRDNAKGAFVREWNKEAFTYDALKAVLLRFCVFGTALFVFTWMLFPELLFRLPLERPRLWAMILVLYPLLSVFPQEMLFRSFFLRRYGAWMTNANLLMAANALAFGWAHIVVKSEIAMVFSAIGGVMFAGTYLKTRSLALVCFEHALYGCWVFTLGLGIFFYSPG